jgi:sigma-B regulation protein RsbU (phosphoserine phosphatase)
MHCLLVEDDILILTLLKGFLTKLGHEVTAVMSGEAAWQAFSASRFPAVICDWDLPRLSGIDLCKRIRENKAAQYPYFILITSFQGDAKFGEAMGAGVDDFISKPVDLNLLSVRLKVAERILAFQGQIGILKGLLPICMYCKKIRGDKQYWETVEAYFKEQTGADFTHSLCPDCYHEKIRPQLDSLRKEFTAGETDPK